VHVLIATDGSELAREAVRTAGPLLNPDMKVTLLTVISDLPADTGAGGIEGPVYTPEQEEEIRRSEQTHAAKSLADTQTVLHEVLPDVTVEQRVDSGDPASAICVAAGDLGVDLVVVGSHGKGFISRVVMGSVSEHVVRHSPAPVLVVQAKEPEKPSR